jgi:hypothetical protein
LPPSTTVNNVQLWGYRHGGETLVPATLPGLCCRQHADGAVVLQVVLSRITFLGAVTGVAVGLGLLASMSPVVNLFTRDHQVRSTAPTCFVCCIPALLFMCTAALRILLVSSAWWKSRPVNTVCMLFKGRKEEAVQLQFTLEAAVLCCMQLAPPLKVVAKNGGCFTGGPVYDNFDC